MHGREQRVLLRHYLEQGLTKAAIAEMLGVDRTTIYRWIRSGQLDRDLDEHPVRYAPRPPVPWKLESYKAIIRERLKQYPELSAVRLFEEIKAAGYEGGYTQVSRGFYSPCRRHSSVGQLSPVKFEQKHATAA